MITDYFVCSGSSAEELQQNVKLSIANGFQPIGGVAVSIAWYVSEGLDVNDIPEETRLYQAVVRMSEFNVTNNTEQSEAVSTGNKTERSEIVSDKREFPNATTTLGDLINWKKAEQK